MLFSPQNIWMDLTFPDTISPDICGMWSLSHQFKLRLGEELWTCTVPTRLFHLRPWVGAAAVVASIPVLALFSLASFTPVIQKAHLRYSSCNFYLLRLGCVHGLLWRGFHQKTCFFYFGQIDNWEKWEFVYRNLLSPWAFSFVKNSILPSTLNDSIHLSCH